MSQELSSIATSRQLDSLTSAFARAINGHSAENVSNTPDMILAAFAGACLDAFNAATQERERWYGRDKDFNAAPQTAAADTMDRSAVDETPRPEGSPKRAHSGESATAAPLTEQDIKRFRVGDILFNDEQARMFCDLAMKGLRAEGAIKTLPDASLLVQRFETALQIAVTADLTPGGVSKAREKAVWDNADEKRGDLLKALTPSAIPSAIPATNEAWEVLMRDMARLRHVEHAAWHAMEACEERDDCFIVPRAEGAELSDLLPEAHPGSDL